MLRDTVRTQLATDTDAPFICATYTSTMRAYVEQLFGCFSDETNQRHVAAAINAGICSIVSTDGIDVGALVVERHSSHIELSQLYILPEYQNRGIGTEIIHGLIGEARANCVPLRLRVLSNNPAPRLYEREGFRVTAATPERVYMERLV